MPLHRVDIGVIAIRQSRPDLWTAAVGAITYVFLKTYWYNRLPKGTE
jgi:hypothetical protein